MAPSTSARIPPRTTSVYEPRRLSLVASLSGPSSVPFRSGSGHGPGTLPVDPALGFSAPRSCQVAPLCFESRRVHSVVITHVANETRFSVLARDRATVSFTSRRRRSQQKIMVSATQRLDPAAARDSRAGRRGRDSI